MPVGPPVRVNRGLRSHPMRNRVWVAMVAGMACAIAAAADEPQAAPPVSADTPADVSADVPADAAPVTPTATRLEGAVGLNMNYAPAYPGSDERAWKLRPGFYLRYGRFSITNSSGYVTRRSDEAVRGVAMELLGSERLRLNLSARFDQGRDAGDAPALSGVGDVPATVRAKLSGSWRFDQHYRLGASIAVDAFGRGGGSLGDVGLAREQHIGDALWTVGSTLTFASDRYMQSYFGVNEAQSAASGYAMYVPPAGLRDISVSTGLRVPLGPHWVWLAHASVGRLLGPAADSPMTRSPGQWSVGSGLAWRF